MYWFLNQINGKFLNRWNEKEVFNNMKLEIKHLNKTIKDQTILNDINLELVGGKIYGLRGKNGAGKTVLLKLICGLIFPNSGQIILDDKILGEDISFPESVGALIETPGFIENYSAWKNLESLASIKNIAKKQEMSNLMSFLGLDPQDKKKVKKYSLGMRQKLGIIMALFENPDLIILDEPLNALDEQTQSSVLELLKKYSANGSLIIISSHDREELDYLADEIIEIVNGQIKQGGSIG